MMGIFDFSALVRGMKAGEKRRLMNPRKFSRGGRPNFANLLHDAGKNGAYRAGRRQWKRDRLAAKKARRHARLRKA